MDELIMRVLSGEAGPIEKLRLATWRAETPQNDRHFQDVSAIWRTSRIPSVPDERTLSPPSVETVVRVGEARRRQSERRRFVRGFGRREVWPWAAAAVVATVSLGIWIGRGVRPGGDLAGTEFVAGSAEATTVALSDGSFARLDRGSTLRFAVAGENREAWLSGRAFFGVASDPQRPFVVHTDLGETRVLGTRFEVSSREDELRVIVIEGRVAVTSTRGRSTELTKGQVATMAANGDFSVATVDDPYALLDWDDGTLVFQGTSLAQVVEEVAAHFGVAVAVEDGLSTRRLTAWFGDDSLEEVVESICLLVEAKCEIGTDGVWIGR